MRHPRRPTEIAVVAGLLLAARLTGAQPTEPTAAQKNAAQSLFDDARKLMDAGNVAEGCAKYEESYRILTASGTLLNLALCHEQLGRTATAYTEFNESLARAQRDRRPEREKIAKDHLAALAPKLSRLTVSVAQGADVEGLQVLLDGVVLQKPAWGVATAVDPGAHVVTAKAPSKRDWSKRIDIGASGDRQSVEVPSLESDSPPAPIAPPPVASSAPSAVPPPPAPSAAPPPREPERIEDTASSGRTVGIVLVSVGGVALAAGTVFGVVAKNKWDTAKSACANAVCADAATQSANSGAGTFADLSTIGFVAGGVAAITGVIWLVAAPRTSDARVRLVPMLAPRVAGVSFEGAL